MGNHFVVQDCIPFESSNIGYKNVVEFHVHSYTKIGESDSIRVCKLSEKDLAIEVSRWVIILYHASCNGNIMGLHY